MGGVSVSKTNPGPLLSDRVPLTYQTSDLHSCRERTEEVEEEEEGGGVNTKGREGQEKRADVQD